MPGQPAEPHWKDAARDKMLQKAQAPAAAAAPPPSGSALGKRKEAAAPPPVANRGAPTLHTGPLHVGAGLPPRESLGGSTPGAAPRRGVGVRWGGWVISAR